MFARDESGTIRYADLRLEMGRAADGLYTLQARFSPDPASPQRTEVLGESRFAIPLSPFEIERALSSIAGTRDAVRRGWSHDTLDPLQQVGRTLFSALFQSSVGEVYRKWLLMVESEGRNRGLRLRLVTDDRQIAGLPWEFLYDPDSARQDFVALSMHSPLVRQWGTVPSPLPLSPVTPPLRIRVVAAELNPAMGIQDELATLRKLAGQSTAPIELEITEDARPETLLEVAPQPIHILHFLGCGAWVDRSSGWSLGPSGADPDQQQGILLMGEGSERGSYRGAQLLDADRLLPPLSTNPELRLVYLDGDHTHRLAAELSTRVPAVLGWGGINTTPEAYLAFTKGFYGALLQGDPLDAAVTQGRRTINVDYPGSREWGLPVFYLTANEALLLPHQRAEHVPASAGPPWRPGSGQAPQDPDRHREWIRTKKRLEIEQQNLAQLEARAAHYGEAVPDFIVRQAQAVRDKIATLQTDLHNLEAE